MLKKLLADQMLVNGILSEVAKDKQFRAPNLAAVLCAWRWSSLGCPNNWLAGLAARTAPRSVRRNPRWASRKSNCGLTCKRWW